MFSIHLFWFVISNSKLNGIKQPVYHPQGFRGPGIWARHSWMASLFHYVLGLSWETSWGLKSADLAPELNDEGWAQWGTVMEAPTHGLCVA